MSDLPKKHIEEDKRIPIDLQEDGTVESFGYDVSYKRVLRTIANVCWVIALTAPMGAVTIMGVNQISNGGYWGLTWGWILPSFIMLPQVFAFGELCSAMPINGATYWWTAALAPPKWSRALSFISGCTTVIAIFTSVASFAYACASTVIICTTIYGSDWEITDAQHMAVAMGIVLIWAVGLSLQLDRIGWLMVVCSIIPLFQTIAYVIGLPVAHSRLGEPFATGSDMFGKYTSYSDWGAGITVPMSWFAAVWANSAWTAPAYIVESTHNARLVTPRSMLTSYCITAVIGCIICIVAAACISDIDMFGMNVSGYPLIVLTVYHWGQPLTFVFVLVGSIAAMIGGCGWLLAYAFQLSAFARDGGLPFAGYLSQVYAGTNTPIYAALALSGGSILILLLSLSSQASGVIYSLAVIVNLMTMALPIGLRLFAGERWAPGPWNLGRWSKLIHAWAFLSQIYFIIMESFPSIPNWTAETFNYNWIVAVAVVVLSFILYVIFGSRYKGINLDALDRYRQEHTTHGGV